MKTILFALSLLGSTGLAATASAADLGAPPPPPAVVVVPVVDQLFPSVIVQLGPTTPYSTINCAEFTKLPDGTWKALGPSRFGLGFVKGIVPPARPIRVGGNIYNNIDLWSQLEEQCVGNIVRARY